LHGVLKTGINSNVDIKTRGELTLVDWVWIFGTLIFVALIWFCIVLLARGANQLATTQAQAVWLPSPPPACKLYLNRIPHNMPSP
jgi:hypothetical protein